MPPLGNGRGAGGDPRGWSRRAFLGRMAAGAAALSFPGAAGRVLRAASAAPAAGGAPTARAVIEIWMWGGPAHVDTFDPKPEAGSDVTGPLGKTIETTASGVRLGELLPELARQARHFALIRGLTHGVNGHETASYIVQTGREPGGRLVHPALGAVVGMLRGYDHGYTGLVPPYVVLTRPKGRFSESGLLGPRYRPFVTGGDPARTPFAVEGIVSEGIPERRQRDRRELLRALDVLGRALPEHGTLDALDRCEAQAYELMLGDAGKVFDLAGEDDALRDRYGRTTFGQSCLAARRLVERGVPYVTINFGGWDTHKQHFQSMRRQLPAFDRGLATLIADLHDRGLLNSTVVWCTGEFGRTPRVQWDPPWNGGRGHFGACFSALLAGGGFEGGAVVGATDARGEEVVDRPVHPREVLAAILERLGIDPHGPLPNPRGLDLRILERPGDGAAKGARALPEIT